MEKIRAFMSTVKYTLKDDRFSWKFKLLNILTSDRLRWELACITIAVHKIQDEYCIRCPDVERPKEAYKHFVSYTARQMKHASDSLNNIWRI